MDYAMIVRLRRILDVLDTHGRDQQGLTVWDIFQHMFPREEWSDTIGRQIRRDIEALDSLGFIVWRLKGRPLTYQFGGWGLKSDNL